MGETDISLGKAIDAAASAHKRVDALEREVKDLRTLTLAIAKVDCKVDNIREDMEEIKQEVQQVVSRPIKWWDKNGSRCRRRLCFGYRSGDTGNNLKIKEFYIWIF